MGSDSRSGVPSHRPDQANAARAAESVVAAIWTIVASAHPSNRDGDHVLFDHCPFRTCNAPAESRRIAVEVGPQVNDLLDSSRSPWPSARVDEGSVLGSLIW